MYNTGSATSLTRFSYDLNRAQSIITINSVPNLHYARGKITSKRNSTVVDAAVTPVVNCYTATPLSPDGAPLGTQTFCPTVDQLTYEGTGTPQGSFIIQFPSRNLVARNVGVEVITGNDAEAGTPVPITVGGANNTYVGSGTDMTINVEIIYRTLTGEEPFFRATIVDHGTGYLTGDTITMTGEQLRISGVLNAVGAQPSWDDSVIFTLTDFNFNVGGNGIDRQAPPLTEFDVGRVMTGTGTSADGAVLTQASSQLIFDAPSGNASGLQHGVQLRLAENVNQGLPSNTLSATVAPIADARGSGAIFTISSVADVSVTCTVDAPGVGYRVGQSIIFAPSDLEAAGFTFGVRDPIRFVVQEGDLIMDLQNVQSFKLGPAHGGTVFQPNAQTSPNFGGSFPNTLVGETIEAFPITGESQKRQIVGIDGYTSLRVDRPFNPPLLTPTQYAISWIPAVPVLPTGLIGGTITSNGQTKTIAGTSASPANPTSQDQWKQFPPQSNQLITTTPFEPPLIRSPYIIRPPL